MAEYISNINKIIDVRQSFSNDSIFNTHGIYNVCNLEKTYLLVSTTVPFVAKGFTKVNDEYYYFLLFYTYLHNPIRSFF